MFGETPSSRRGGSFFARVRESNSFAGLGEPLLAEGSTVWDAAERPTPWLVLWAMVPLAGLQLAFGAGEKVVFARMASVLPHSCLLIHTHLAALNALLYSLLQVARSQSRASPVPDRLRQVKPSRVLVMGLLDATHSLLVIDAAETLRGTTQATLMQAALPLSVLALALTTRLARRASGGGGGAAPRCSRWPAVQTAAALTAAAAIVAAMLASPEFDVAAGSPPPTAAAQRAAIPEGGAAGWKPGAVWEAGYENGGWVESDVAGTPWTAGEAALIRRGAAAAAADLEGLSGGFSFDHLGAVASTQRLRPAAAGQEGGLARHVGSTHSDGGADPPLPSSSAEDSMPTLLFGEMAAEPLPEASPHAPLSPVPRVGTAHRVAASELREGGSIWLLANRSLAAIQASPHVCSDGTVGANRAGSLFSMGHGDADGGPVASAGAGRAGGAGGPAHDGPAAMWGGGDPAAADDGWARGALAVACHRLRGASVRRVVEASEQVVAGLLIRILAEVWEAGGGGRPGEREAGASAFAASAGGAGDCQLRLDLWHRPWLHSVWLDSAALSCPVAGPAGGSSEALLQVRLLSSPLLLGGDGYVPGSEGGDVAGADHRPAASWNAPAGPPSLRDASAGALVEQLATYQLAQQQQQQSSDDKGQQEQQQSNSGKGQQEQQQQSSDDKRSSSYDSQTGTFKSDTLRSRLLFVAGVGASVCSTSIKARWLAEAPVDVLLLNTYVPLTQLVAGLGLGPLLLLAVHGQPILLTLRNTVRSLYCYVASLIDAIVSGPEQTQEEQKLLASLSPVGLRSREGSAGDEPSAAAWEYAAGAAERSAGGDGPASAPHRGPGRLGTRNVGGNDARRAGGSGIEGVSTGDHADSGGSGSGSPYGSSDPGWSCSGEETNLLPILLIFFIVSSLWSALSFVLLRWGPPPLLHATAALLYPVTLFGFVSPIRQDLWALLAPPEPFGPAQVAAATVLSAAIAAFIFAATGCCGLRPGRAHASKTGSPATEQAAASSSVGTSPPAGADEADNDASNASTALAVPPFLRHSCSISNARPGLERTDLPAYNLRPSSCSSAADVQHSPVHGALRAGGTPGAALLAAADGRFDAGAARAPDELRLGLRHGALSPTRRQPDPLALSGATGPATGDSIFAWQ